MKVRQRRAADLHRVVSGTSGAQHAVVHPYGDFVGTLQQQEPRGERRVVSARAASCSNSGKSAVSALAPERNTPPGDRG
jgi:hypothetical protein